MFTVCPKCALTLVVTAADLRVAQGYVRCGRCLNVFNALARLSEERPGAAPAAMAEETAQREAPAQSAAPQAAAPPQPLEPPSPPASSAPAAPSGESDLADTSDTSAAESIADTTGEIAFELDSSVIVTSARGPTAPLESADLEGQTGQEPPQAATAASADSGAEPVAVTPAAVAQKAETSATEEETSEASSPAPASTHTADAHETNTAQARHDAIFEAEAPRPRAGLAWTLGAAALVIALALQIVNHYRDALAAASPALRGPLSTVYSALGVKLAPRWDIHAYDVRQLGASVAGATAGEIIVRASVKNTASSAQPLPLLRVTLQDRFGNRIAARDVPPPDYLPSSVAPGTLLAAGSRVDATMVFVDPGPQAVGFEIDACLRRQSGEVACAHGP